MKTTEQIIKSIEDRIKWYEDVKRNSTAKGHDRLYLQYKTKTETLTDLLDWIKS